MNDPLDDLVQRVLEGEASAGERADLEARIAADPAARARHDELSRVFGALGAVRLEDPPAGIRDEVLRAIRGAAPARSPAPSRSGRSPFSWARILLPAAAGAVAALALIANWQGPTWRSPGDRAAGTMSGAGAPVALRIGPGTSAVQVDWAPSGSGFELRLRAGDTPVRLTLEALSEGTLLKRAGGGAPAPAAEVDSALPANALLVVECTGPESRAVVRVSVVLPDGRTASGEVRTGGRGPVR